MITVTFTSKGDLVVVPECLNSVGIFGYMGSVALLVATSPKTKYKTGLRPINGPSDEYGEKPCSHVNVEGHLVALGLDSQLVAGVQINSYLDSTLSTVQHVVRCSKFKATPTIWFSHLHDVTNPTPLTITEPWKFSLISTYPVAKYNKTLRWTRLCPISRTCYTTIIFTQTVDITSGLTTFLRIRYQSHEFNETFTKWRSGAQVTYYDDPLKIYNGFWKQPTGIWNNVDTTRRLVMSVDSDNLPRQFSNKTLYECAVSVRSRVRTQSFLDFGDLATQAAGNTRYLEINSSKYLADLFQIGNMLQPFAGLSMFSNLSLKKAIKLLSSSTLMLDYGVRLTVKDSTEILEALERLRRSNQDLNQLVCSTWSIARSRGVENATCRFGNQDLSTVSTKNLKFRYRPHDDLFLSSLQTMDAWDFLPTLRTAVDFVPFSYLFTGLLPGLRAWIDRVDGNTHKALLRVGDCVYSSRLSIQGIDAMNFIGSSGQNLWGSVDVTFYERYVSATLPSSDISRIPGTVLSSDGLARSVRDGLFIIVSTW